MNQTELYLHLQDIADKLGIRVQEKNFRVAGVPVSSGLCKVEGRYQFYMDKYLKIKEKNKALAASLVAFPLEEIFMPPVVRTFLETFK